jgi:hypothetical protein
MSLSLIKKLAHLLEPEMSMAAPPLPLLLPRRHRYGGSGRFSEIIIAVRRGSGAARQRCGAAAVRQR